jgi:hypothetical protein
MQLREAPVTAQKVGRFFRPEKGAARGALQRTLAGRRGFIGGLKREKLGKISVRQHRHIRAVSHQHGGFK